MTNGITNRQMFFIIFITLSTYSTIDLPQLMARTAGRSSWIPIIISTVVFGIAAVIITKLNSMFQGKVFFDYSQVIVGRFLAYVLAFYYIFYFLYIGVFLKLKLVGVLTTNFLPKTPQFVFLLFGIAAFSFVAYKGVTNIARMFEIFGAMFLFVTVGICVLMLIKGMKYNILPFFNPSEVKQYPKAIWELLVPFGGAEILLIIPFSHKNKKAPIIAAFSLLFVGLFFILIVESTIKALGINNTIVLNNAFIEALKVTNAPIIERLDIFYLTFGMAGLFSAIIIVFTSVVEYVCRVFSKVKRYIIVIMGAIISFVLCLFALNMKDVEKYYESYTPFLVVISNFLIPIVVYLVARIRKPAGFNWRKIQK